jgi:hypothetical protein
MPVILLLLH